MFSWDYICKRKQCVFLGGSSLFVVRTNEVGVFRVQRLIFFAQDGKIGGRTIFKDFDLKVS